VWGGAGPHRGKELRALPTARVSLPPYAPELNPAERVFEEVRQRVGGKIYADLAAKRAEAFLAELAAGPARVRRLCGWDWVVAALDALPPPAEARR
jgi:transposase